ncbi:MAG: PKD domain-containing protein [Patescibacteria group bacterium]
MTKNQKIWLKTGVIATILIGISIPSFANAAFLDYLFNPFKPIQDLIGNNNDTVNQTNTTINTTTNSNNTVSSNNITNTNSNNVTTIQPTPQPIINYPVTQTIYKTLPAPIIYQPASQTIIQYPVAQTYYAPLPQPITYQPSYYNNYSYNNTLTASCSANLTSINLGESVTWTAYAYGGNGSYTYSWNGNDSLYYNNSSSNWISARYANTGTKYVTLTVYSGNQTVTQLCNNQVFVHNPVASNANYNSYSAPTKKVASVSKVQTVQASNDTSCGPTISSISITSGKDTITKTCANNIAPVLPSQTEIPWGLISIIIIIILAFFLVYVIAKKS